MSYRRPEFHHPHFVDHERKAVWMYVASGWPAVMAVPKWMDEFFSDLKDYEGGEVVVGIGGLDELTIPKEKGSLTIFPSFLPHKVLEVTKGTRQSICGWVSGKSWE